MKRNSESGSAIIMLFIAVALFGLLAYAFMQSSRTSTSWLENESDKATASGTQDCNNAVTLATKRLEARGCGNLISFEPDGRNFHPSAPQDGSCSIYHTQGGGVRNCLGLAASTEPCGPSPYWGQVCPDGSIYIGEDGGMSVFTQGDDLPGKLTWGSIGTFRNATSSSDGIANNALLEPHGNAHPAAWGCSTSVAHGYDDWFLPSSSEFLLLRDGSTTVQNLKDCNAGVNQDYWVSTEHDANSAKWRSFPAFLVPGTGSGKSWNMCVRCIRKQ